MTGTMVAGFDVAGNIVDDLALAVKVIEVEVMQDGNIIERRGSGYKVPVVLGVWAGKHLPGQHDQKSHGVRLGAGVYAKAEMQDGLEVTKVWLGTRIISIKRDPEVTSPDAVAKIRSYMDILPLSLVPDSSFHTVEVYDDMTAACDRITELTNNSPEAEYSRGMYDRNAGKAVVSLYIDEDTSEFPGNEHHPAGESGRNFYHEFAHSLDRIITSSAWQDAWMEWEGNSQDEDFAEAFSEYMVEKRLGDTSWMQQHRPLTWDLMQSIDHS